MLKELATNTSFDLGRPPHHQHDALLGQGILAPNGQVWAHQRKILAPEFFMDKVKVHFKMVKNCETFRHMFIPLVFDKKSFLDEIP